MKKAKAITSIGIYKIYHCPSGHEAYLDTKPSKKDLIEIASKEGWEDIDDIEITRIVVYTKDEE